MFRALLPFIFTTLVLVTLAQAQPVSVSATQTAFATGACSGTFVKHPLDHTTRAHGPEVTFYDSNGAGVAAGDLDGDGDVDLVLANLNGKNSIFWNEGELHFRKEALAHGDSRAAAVVDVDGDGLLDIVFTQNLGALSYWKNAGGGFEQSTLRGVTRKAYTFAWGDLDRGRRCGLGDRLVRRAARAGAQKYLSVLLGRGRGRLRKHARRVRGDAARRNVASLGARAF